MTLVVHAPESYEPERRYILEVVLSDWLGLDWRLKREARSDICIRLDGEGPDPCVVLPDVLFGTAAATWLSPPSLPTEPLAHGTVDGMGSRSPVPVQRLPVLFGAHPAAPVLVAQTPHGSRVEVDVFGAAFFMLTRYEEVVVSERDQYGRFPASSSLAARAGFLGSAIVDAYTEVLWSALTRVWPRLRRRQRAFDIHISHDVDDPLSTLGRTPAAIGRQLGADLLARRDIRLAARRTRSLAATRRGDHRLDPYNTFDFLMDVSEANRHTSAFYFLANRDPTPEDGSYQLGDPWIRSLIERIHRRGHEVGLHASFHSYRDPARTKDEFARLVAIAEYHGVRQERWGGRQHYLRWANPVTWRNWDAAGLSYDTTLAYADALGFRSGTCHPYRVFDLEARRPLALWERPFQVMDVTLFQYMSQSPENAHSSVMDIAAECRRYGGSLGILWHNSSLPSDRQKRWYESMIRAVSRP